MTTSDPERAAGVAAAGASGVSGLVLPYAGRLPRLHPGVWLAPGAVVAGDVELGPDTSLWFGAVVRGDVHAIRVGARTNLQDHCVLHVTAGQHPCLVGDEVTVGHRATVHGCTVGDGALIGIAAVVLDGAEIGEEALVAAGALVPPGVRIPPRHLARGVPARVARPLEPGEIRHQRERALEYVETARRYRESGVGGVPPGAFAAPVGAGGRR